MSFWISRVILGERDVKLVPSFSTLVRDMLVSYQVFDAVFFFFHRIMHSKYFYKKIHKIHHEWKAPIGVMAVYAHPTGFNDGFSFV
jgi:fatty acid hydroxylase domain-containing protein 2